MWRVVCVVVCASAVAVSALPHAVLGDPVVGDEVGEPHGLEEDTGEVFSVSIRGEGQLGLVLKDTKKGVVVQDATQHGVGYGSGIRSGDVLVGINGVSIDSKDSMLARLQTEKRPFVINKRNGPNNDTPEVPSLPTAGAPIHRPHSVRLADHTLGFAYTVRRRQVVVTAVHDPASGVLVGDVVYAVNGERVRQGVTLPEMKRVFRSAQLPLVVQFNGEGALALSDDASASSHAGTEGNRLALSVGEAGCEDVNATGTSTVLPPLVADYKTTNPLPFTKDSAVARNRQLFWDKVLSPGWEAHQWNPPMSVEDLRLSMDQQEHRDRFERFRSEQDANNSTAPSDADVAGEMAVVSGLVKAKTVKAGQQLKLQSLVKNAARYAWEWHPRVAAEATDEGWKLLSLQDASKQPTAAWGIDKLRTSDTGSYRLIAFAPDMQTTITQVCRVTVQADKAADPELFANNEHKLDECVDGMNADPHFFVDVHGVQLPPGACVVPLDFCQTAQLQFCERSKPCDVDVKCRHLIRDCYVQHYDSRKLFAECFYAAISRPHAVAVSADASLRSVEIDQGEVEHFTPNVTRYDVWVPPPATAVRFRLQPAIGARVLLRACAAIATKRSDTKRLNEGDWSDPCPIDPDNEVDYCFDVTAQDGKTTRTYQLTTHRGPAPSADTVLTLTIPELMNGFSHDRVYFDELDAGQRSRLHVNPHGSEERYHMLVGVNGFPMKEGRIVDLVVGRNMIQVQLVDGGEGNEGEEGESEFSPVYTVFVRRQPSVEDVEEAAQAAEKAEEKEEGGDNGNSTALVLPPTALASLEVHVAHATKSAVSVPLTYSPAFQPHLLLYVTTIVPHSCHNATLTVEAMSDKAVVSINDVAYEAGKPSALLPLLEGVNVLEVEVVAPDGSARLVYRVYVERQSQRRSGLDPDDMQPALSSLKLHSASGVSNIDTSTLTMHHMAKGDEDWVYLVPTTASSAAIVELRDNSVHNGHELHIVKPHRRFALRAGPNRFDVRVWFPRHSDSPSTAQTALYTVIVEKPIASLPGLTDSLLENLFTNANAASLFGGEAEAASKTGMLSPEFSPDVFSYSLKLVSEITHVVVWADPRDPDALVVLDHQSIDPDEGSLPIAVRDRNVHRVEVEVTAPDNMLAHKTVYTLFIQRASNNAELVEWPFQFCRSLASSSCAKTRGNAMDPTARMTAMSGFDGEFQIAVAKGSFFRHMPQGAENPDGTGAALKVVDVDGSEREVLPGVQSHAPWFRMTTDNVRQAVVVSTSEDHSTTRTYRLTIHQVDIAGAGMQSLMVRGSAQHSLNYWEGPQLAGFKKYDLDQPFKVFHSSYKTCVDHEDTVIALVIKLPGDVQSVVDFHAVAAAKQCLGGTLHRTLGLADDGAVVYVVDIPVTQSCGSGTLTLPEGPNKFQITLEQSEPPDEHQSSSSSAQVPEVAHTTYDLEVNRKFQSLPDLMAAFPDGLSHDARLRQLVVVVGEARPQSEAETLEKGCTSATCTFRKVPDDFMNPAFSAASKRSRQTHSIVLGGNTRGVWVMYQSVSAHAHVVVDGDAVVSSADLQRYSVPLSGESRQVVTVAVTAQDTTTAITYEIELHRTTSNNVKLLAFSIGARYLKLLFSQTVPPTTVHPEALLLRSRIASHSNTVRFAENTKVELCCCEEGLALDKCIGSPHIHVPLTPEDVAQLHAMQGDEWELVVTDGLLQHTGDSTNATVSLSGADMSDQFTVHLSRSLTTLRRWTALLDSRALLLFEFSRPVDRSDVRLASLVFKARDGSEVQITDTDAESLFVVDPSKWEMTPWDQHLHRGIISYATAPEDGGALVFNSLLKPNLLAIAVEKTPAGRKLLDRLRALARQPCPENSQLLSPQRLTQLVASYMQYDKNGDHVLSPDEMLPALEEHGLTDTNARLLVGMLMEHGQLAYHRFVLGASRSLVPLSVADAEEANSLLGSVDSLWLDESGTEFLTKNMHSLDISFATILTSAANLIRSEMHRLNMDPSYNTLTNGPSHTTRGCSPDAVRADLVSPGNSDVSASVISFLTLTGALPQTTSDRAVVQDIQELMPAKDGSVDKRKIRCQSSDGVEEKTRQSINSRTLLVAEFGQMMRDNGVLTRSTTQFLEEVMRVRECALVDPDTDPCVSLLNFKLLSEAQLMPLHLMLELKRKKADDFAFECENKGECNDEAQCGANEKYTVQCPKQCRMCPAALTCGLEALYTRLASRVSSVEHLESPRFVLHDSDKSVAVSDFLPTLLQDEYGDATGVTIKIDQCLEPFTELVNDALHVDKHVATQLRLLKESFELLTAGAPSEGLHIFLLKQRIQDKLGMPGYQASLITSPVYLSRYGARLQFRHFVDMVYRKLLPPTMEEEADEDSKCHPAQGEIHVEFPPTFTTDDELGAVRACASDTGPACRASVVLTADTTEGCDCALGRKDASALTAADLSALGVVQHQGKHLQLFTNPHHIKQMCDVDTHSCQPPPQIQSLAQALVDVRQSAAMDEMLVQYCSEAREGLSCGHGAGRCLPRGAGCVPVPFVRQVGGDLVLETGTEQTTGTIAVRAYGAGACAWHEKTSPDVCPEHSVPALCVTTGPSPAVPVVRPLHDKDPWAAVACELEPDTGLCTLTVTLKREGELPNPMPALQLVAQLAVTAPFLPTKVSIATCDSPITIHTHNPLEFELG